MQLSYGNRIIFKKGKVNTSKHNVGRCFGRYINDGFTTFIDASWAWTIMTYSCLLIASWTIYASLWYAMAVGHGDIEYYKKWNDAVDRDQFEQDNRYTPCVRNLYSFMSAFLYSMETQQSIGYGFRHITEGCNEAPVLLATQSITGTLLTCFLMGGIIAKLARPKTRAQNIIFSKKAVISHRNGIPYLMFRVADTRESHIIRASIKARIVRRKMTDEGELIDFYQQDLKLTTDECDDRVLLMWPTVLAHRIDEKSPLYNVSSIDLLREKFEIIVILEGGVESTGLATQARTSYLSSEILWGHRFQNIVTHDENASEYHIDYNLFHNTIWVETSPTCSPKQLERSRNFNVNITQTFNNDELVLKPAVHLNGNAKAL
ncbi:unnamed protein product [Chironomus riparius]|uniref:Uncharacterized protein n=1 Tax=Chironomus riparius TaxID=315576 RepID=A0A9P0J5K8_9DIPT|nr:unnamed protein product [Chironomus riparius]